MAERTAWMFAATVASALAACRAGDPGSAAQEVPRPRLEEGLYLVADVRVADEPAPPRFAAELPASVEAVEAAGEELPRTYLESRLCAGNPEVVERLGRAVTQAASSASPDALRKAYGPLLEWCGRPTLCTWTRRAVASGGPLAEVAWVGLAQCGDAADEALFEQEDVPAGPLVEFWSQRSWEEGFVPRYVPGLVPALRWAAAAGDASLTRKAAFLLGKEGEPRGTAALVALHGELPAGDLRDEVAVGLKEAKDPAGQAIFRELCGRSGRRDPVCGDDRELVKILEGLGVTVESAESSPKPSPPKAENAVHREGIEGRLRQLGLLWRGPLGLEDWTAEDEGAAATAQDLLVRSGPVHCFDVETGTYPTQHDKLLYELAELGGPPLAEALFVEAPPASEGKGEPYRLHAYLAGRSYSVDAQDFGDWYDLEQVLGLLNAVARDRGAEIRFAALPTEDQIACVLAAPRKALAAAVSQGLLELDQAGAAREVGQGHEAEVLRQIESGEIPLGKQE